MYSVQTLLHVVIGTQVLFLEIEHGMMSDRIALLASVLSDHFTTNGLKNNGKDFNPHVTIAKMSKMYFGRGQWRKKERNQDKCEENNEVDDTCPEKERLTFMPEDSFIDLADIEAGAVTISELHLCEMGGREPNSYYNIAAQIPLDST